MFTNTNMVCEHNTNTVFLIAWTTINLNSLIVHSFMHQAAHTLDKYIIAKLRTKVKLH